MKRTAKGAGLFAALTGVAFLVGVSLCYMLYGSYSDSSWKAEKLEKAVSDEPALHTDLDKSRTSLIEGAQQLQHLELGVATTDFVPTLLKNLEDTGRDCSLQIIGVRPVAEGSSKGKKKAASSEAPPEGKVKKKPYLELDVEVKVAGMFTEVMEFLKRLEDFPKIVAVRSVSITPKIESDGLTINRLESTISLRVFVFPVLTSVSNNDGSKAGGA